MARHELSRAEVSVQEELYWPELLARTAWKRDVILKPWRVCRVHRDRTGPRIHVRIDGDHCLQRRKV